MAQAVTTDTPSPFLAKLLAPLAVPLERRRFLADLRRDAEDIWSIAQHRFYAAQAYRDHCAHIRRAAEIERKSLRVPEAGEEQRACLAMITAIDKMMHVPAPTLGALRAKQKLRQVDGGRDRWETEIAADVEALAARSCVR